MAFATIIKKMKEDTTCSICLQLMRVPSSINCGHNFCHQCIEDIIENQDVWSQQRYCPLCRRMFDKNSLRPNKQLENLIETIELMETDMLCEKHGEQLHLFCENDGQVICWSCDQSPLHRRHRHVLIKDASLKYKNKVQAALTKLRKQELICMGLKPALRIQMNKCAMMAEHQREKIESGFQNLFHFLNEEREFLLTALETEKSQIQNRLLSSTASLQEQKLEFRSLIQTLEKKCEGSAQNLLKDVKDILSRSSALKLKVPEAVSLKFHTACNISEFYYDVRNILMSYQVGVTLDAETAHDNLILSNNRTRVTHGGSQKKCQNSRRFSVLPCVLGCENFTSGRHYFEVGVRAGRDWDVGVCLGNVPRNSDLKQRPNSGFWVIRSTANGCIAMTDADPATSLSLSDYLQVVGIFLDYEAGRVSFYNMPTGSHIFTFPRASFSGALRPFFQIQPFYSLYLPLLAVKK